MDTDCSKRVEDENSSSVTGLENATDRNIIEMTPASSEMPEAMGEAADVVSSQDPLNFNPSDSENTARCASETAVASTSVEDLPPPYKISNFKTVEELTKVLQSCVAHRSADGLPSAYEEQLKGELKDCAFEAETAAKACQILIEVMEKSIDILQEQAEGYLSKARIEAQANLPASRYYIMAERIGGYQQDFRTKSRILEEYVNAAFNTAETLRGSILEFESGLTLDNLADSAHSIFRSKDRTEGTCSSLYKEEYSALQTVREIQDHVKEMERLADLSDEILPRYKEQVCQNRKRRTVVGLLISSMFAVSIPSLLFFLKEGTDAFDSVLTVSVLLVAAYVMYWSVRLYKSIKACKKETETDFPLLGMNRTGPFGHLNERLAFVEEHLEKLNISFDSTPNSEE